MKTRFALYLIPSGDLLRIGSKITGYNIRDKQPVEPYDFIRSEWIAENTQYGFHVTITDAIEIDDSQIPAVRDKIEQLLACLRPTNTYTLTKKRVGFWRSESNMAVMLLEPSRHVELLHDIMVATLHPMGKGSDYSQRYLQDKANFKPNTPTDIQRLEQFYSPYIFDDFVPHFTCISTFEGIADDRAAVETQLATLFEPFESLAFESVALVVQKEGERYFSIDREFSLG